MPKNYTYIKNGRKYKVNKKGKSVYVGKATKSQIRSFNQSNRMSKSGKTYSKKNARIKARRVAKQVQRNKNRIASNKRKKEFSEYKRKQRLKNKDAKRQSSAKKRSSQRKKKKQFKDYSKKYNNKKRW